MPINGEKPASTSVSRHDRKMGAGAEQEGEGDGAAVSPVQREQGGQGAEPTPTLFAGPTSSAPSPTTCRHDFTSDHSGGPADDESDDITTWADVALSLGAELMSLVRSTVVSRLGYTTSAGIAPNKSLAKLCSGWKKPDAQTIMRPSATRNFLQDLPFQKIRFLGGKLGEAIAAEWESSTVGELWNVGLEEMQGRFGTESKWVWNLLRGIDHAEVKEKIANKTMLYVPFLPPPLFSFPCCAHAMTDVPVCASEPPPQRIQKCPSTDPTNL